MNKKYYIPFILLVVGVILFLAFNKPELIFFPSKTTAKYVKDNYTDTVKNVLNDIEFDFNYKYILAIICRESAGKVDAVGADGELGLMQPLYSTTYDVYNWWGRTDILNIFGITSKSEKDFQDNYWLHMYEPVRNIRMGCFILKMNRERYGIKNDFDLIRSYNAGLVVKDSSLKGLVYLQQIKAYYELM
jgi:soluble lytic murein transglycosylase-like protein